MVMNYEELYQQYGHLSYAELEAEIARQRALAEAESRYAAALRVLRDRMTTGGFTTLGEMIAAEDQPLHLALTALDDLRVAVPRHVHGGPGERMLRQVNTIEAVLLEQYASVPRLTTAVATAVADDTDRGDDTVTA